MIPRRIVSLNIDKLFTDVFDFCASTYAKTISNGTEDKMPDVSRFDISHLITPEMKSDRSKFYTLSDTVPDIMFHKTQKLPFLEIMEGTFQSPVESPFPENNIVTVWYYRLRGKPGGGPTVVIINGLGVDANTYLDWYCWRFAAWGLSSILINIPYHIRRVPRGSHSGEYLLAPETDWSLLSLKQSFEDTQQLVNWLKDQGAGDIGTFGVSFGALMSGLYICNAKNADFAIMGMPPMDSMDVIGKLRFGEQLKALEAKGRKTMLTDPVVPPLFNMGLMTPNIPNEKIFIAKGIYDHLVPPETIDEVAKAWGGLPWLRTYPTGHINTFVFNLRFIRDVERFVKKEIVNG